MKLIQVKAITPKQRHHLISKRQTVDSEQTKMKCLSYTYNFLIKSDWRGFGWFRPGARRNALRGQTQILGTVLVKAESTIWKNQKPPQLKSRSTLKQTNNLLILSFSPSAKSADVTLKSTTGLSWWPSYSGVMIIKLLLIALLMNHCLMCAASTQTVCICLVVGWCSEISWSISSRTTLSFDGYRVNTLIIKG